MFGYRNLGFGAFPNRDVTFSVSNSARFNDGDSDHLTQVSTKLGNQFRWTLAFWFKLGVLDGRKHFFGQDDSYISINENSSTSHKINIYNVGRGAASGSNVTGWYWETAALFRDPHAWYHLTVAFDSLQSDAADALRVYVNGVELTAFDPKHSNGSQYNGTVTNAGFHDFGSAEKMVIGKHPVNAAQYWDGYLAEMVYVNGRQLAPTSFGEFDTAGRWKPKDLTDTLTISTTSEAIVNVASAVDALSGGDTTSATFSSVALGTASATREAYVFVSGQENTGTAGTITATMNTGSGAVAMTKVMDVNNATEAHYQSSLFRVSVPSGTSGDIAVTNTRNMSQIGVIVWTVTGDHHLFDIVADTDTSSNNTTSVSLTDVPANSVILAGRAGSVGYAHTWSSNLTENIDEVIEGTVRHTGASTATASGGDFTITCVPDSSGTDGRGRMFALALSPTEGAGRNGFYLKFDDSNNIGRDANVDFNNVTAPTKTFLSSAVDNSNDTSYTFSSVSFGSAASNRSIVVGISGGRATAGARSVSSVTIGGVTATIAAEQDSPSNRSNLAAIAFAKVPTGTSGDIVVNFTGGTMIRAGIGVWSATDLGGVIDTSGDADDANADLTSTLTGSEGAIAFYHLYDEGDISGVSFSNATERYEDLSATFDDSTDDPAQAGADYTFTSSGSVSVVATLAGNGNDGALIGVAFGRVGENQFVAG